jgi:hypothetical protein
MGTVTDSGLRAYLATFHDVYRHTAETLVPEDIRQSLIRYPLLSSGIVAYISTMHGAGYEYSDGVAGFEVRKSSRRIEDLFFDPPPRLRVNSRGMGTGMSFRGNVLYTIEDVSWNNIIPFRLESPSGVTLIDVTASCRGWTRRVRYAELRTDRSQEFWSEMNAAIRAKDELLLALVDVREAQRRSVTVAAFLKQLKDRYVLLLGDFSASGRTRLESIRGEVSGAGYVPILLDELPELPHYDLMNKASIMSLACRFVVMDDSSAAGHLAEVPIVLANRSPLIVLRAEGTASSFVSHGIAAGSGGRVQELTYSPDSLSECLRLGIENTESWILEYGKALSSVYPWRQTNDG